jgi:tryptophan-rich sensory protein
MPTVASAIRSPGSKQSVVGLVVCLGICFGVAAVAGLFPPGEWYADLRKPAWNPPNWIFGPVWTVLYTMMAIAAWLVWKQGNASGRRAALTLFAVQLGLNALWSAIFFGWHRPGLAFVELLLLCLAVFATIVLFWKVTLPAGVLLLPYLAWLIFAAALNWSLWKLNSPA